METKNKKPPPGCELVIYLLIFVLTFGACVGFWVFSSSMEAAAYNRVTGKHVSTWDAMWIELRVQESVK